MAVITLRISVRPPYGAALRSAPTPRMKKKRKKTTNSLAQARFSEGEQRGRRRKENSTSKPAAPSLCETVSVTPALPLVVRIIP
jgi:hypothetical protein